MKILSRLVVAECMTLYSMSISKNVIFNTHFKNLGYAFCKISIGVILDRWNLWRSSSFRPHGGNIWTLQSLGRSVNIYFSSKVSGIEKSKAVTCKLYAIFLGEPENKTKFNCCKNNNNKKKHKKKQNKEEAKHKNKTTDDEKKGIRSP